MADYFFEAHEVDITEILQKILYFNLIHYFRESFDKHSIEKPRPNTPYLIKMFALILKEFESIIMDTTHL